MHYVLELPKLKIWACVDCQAFAPHEDAASDVRDALRRYLRLLDPATIRAGREARGLSQQELATLLFIDFRTVHGCESGSIVQTRSFDTLLRIFFDSPAVRQRLVDWGNYWHPAGRVPTPVPREGAVFDIGVGGNGLCSVRVDPDAPYSPAIDYATPPNARQEIEAVPPAVAASEVSCPSGKTTSSCHNPYCSVHAGRAISLVKTPFDVGDGS